MDRMTAEIRIESEGDATNLEKYSQRLRTLLLTPEGSLIGNRDFGISFDLVSMEPHQAENMLVIELQKKLPIFIPEIQLDKVIWSADINGRAVFTVQIRKAKS